MESQQAMVTALTSAQEGDVLELGNLWPGLSDQKLDWQVTEKCVDPKNTARIRITLHGYVMGVFWRSVVGYLSDTAVEWK